jgi:type IV pilus assembly protein PilE
METKSSGFSLIELLVVVAILGIIAAIGTVAYSGYVSSAKKKSAQNIMLQISLGQVEYHSDNGDYWNGSSGATCTPTLATSDETEKELLGGADSINEDMGYYMCVVKSSSDYKIIAEENIKGTKKCKMEMPKSTKITLVPLDNPNC